MYWPNAAFQTELKPGATDLTELKKKHFNLKNNTRPAVRERVTSDQRQSIKILLNLKCFQSSITHIKYKDADTYGHLKIYDYQSL